MRVRARHFLFFISVVGFLSSEHVVAGNYTTKDLVGLPPYCVARLSLEKDHPTYLAWGARLGKQWIHIHHYCFGLIFLNNARTERNARERQFEVERSRSNFEYVIRRVDDTYILKPEILVNQARALELDPNRVLEALPVLDQAIKIKPDYVPAYAELSDLWVRLGDEEKALETLEMGLEQAPRSRSLRRRHSELMESQDLPASDSEESASM